MPTVTQAVQFLEDVTDVAPATIKAIARKLLDDDLLPKSSGKRIAQIGVRQFARLLFAVYAAPTVREATAVALKYSTMAQPSGRFYRSQTDDDDMWDRILFDRLICSRGFTAEECVADTLTEIISIEPIRSSDFDRVGDTKISINLSHPQVVYSNIARERMRIGETGEVRQLSTFYTITFNAGTMFQQDLWEHRPARLVQIPFATFLSLALMWLDTNPELKSMDRAQRVTHLRGLDVALESDLERGGPRHQPDIVNADPQTAHLVTMGAPLGLPDDRPSPTALEVHRDDVLRRTLVTVRELAGTDRSGSGASCTQDSDVT